MDLLPLLSASISSIFLLLVLSSPLSVSISTPAPVTTLRPTSSTPFPTALAALEKELRYDFKTPGLLRRAMTHSSYSGDNYRSLAVLGLHVLQASVSLSCFQDDPDVSPSDLSRRIDTATSTDSCAADGDRLGLDGIVRVSPKTNASTPSVVCGAFRAIFGAVAVDSGDVASAGEVFRRVHKARRAAVVFDH